MGSQATREELLALVARINAAAESLGTSEAQEASNARENLLLECKRLVASVEDADAAVWPRAFQVNVAVSIDIAATLGIWEKMRDRKCISLSDILKETKADAATIVRILRQLTAAGLLSEVSDLDEPAYGLTRLGHPYLDPNHISFNRFILQEVVPTARHSIKQKCFRPEKHPEDTPQNRWIRLTQDPARAADMVKGMKSLSCGGLAPTAYPFGAELEKLGLIREDDIAIVDVAGGRGHIMEGIRKQNPGLKGRIIVQDLQAVLDAVPGGPPNGVEFMAHDIFKPQPITNAHVYYLRHIIHDWDDDSATVILSQLTPIMRARPQTKLLLADLVLPTTGVEMQEAVRDFTMFRIGGLERTEAQWLKLLARCGLGMKRIWRGTEPEACVECTLLEVGGDGEAT
ncbi:O-methyltransferase [Diaporthe helianthi]|uniref:O-methyltransferase n=1 Tax=Diaporthe helianthi TaxID=158607 RepID=A0A2P5IBU8_DIAHE|nr:O-methyltransferase [Diaporthe helianthi]